MERGYAVQVNGVRQRLTARAGDYVTLSRRWKPGDTITVAMPFSLRAERALDDPAAQSIAYGPVPLVTKSPATGYLSYSFYADFDLSGDLDRAITPTDTPNTFTTHGLTLAPFHLADTDPYHMYFRRTEPQIVFGAVDSGVPNVPRADGLTLLDQVWVQAPFRHRAGFLLTVARTSQEWVREGLLTREQQRAVISAAARADLGP